MPDNFNNNDERDRTVPPEEDYYGRVRPDLDFNAKVSRRGEYGINPTTEYQYRQTESGLNRKNQTPQPQNGKEPKKSGKSKKRGKAIAIAVVAVILALVLGLFGSVESVLGKINYDDKTQNEYIAADKLTSSDKVKNILLLGVDARSNDKDEASRADTMMLISIDKAHGCIKMTSFQRDSWVYIPKADKKQRLNAACTYGGYSGVVDTIEYNFGVKIDGYVVTDFEMFKVMVDSIGGVEAEISEKEANEVTNHPGRYGNVTLKSGKYKLTGEQALAYCRIRKIDTDWKRTERQRTIMQAILKGVVSSGPISAIKTAKAVAPYIQTNLSKSEIKSIALSALGCVSGGFEQASCPFEGTWKYANKGGASVITLDVDSNKEKLIDFIYNSDKTTDSAEQ